MTYSEKIKTRRIELGLTLQQVADYCDVNRSTVFHWENGNIQKMKLDYIYKLAKILKVEPSSLAFDDEDLVPATESISSSELESEIFKLIQLLPFKDKIELYNQLNKKVGEM